MDRTNTRDIVLTVSGLSMTYKNAQGPALDRLDLSVATGTILGLLGPNGAGKTTAISLVSTLRTPTAGRILIGGIDPAVDPYGVRRLIGVVPQEIAVYDNLTAGENIDYFGRLYGLKGRVRREYRRFALDFAGLTRQTGQRVQTFSGGMKRRLNLAVGLLHHPRLLFLDEPTVGIDTHSRNMILEKLLSLKSSGMSMVYTTHYMEEAERLCDEVVVIDEGRCIVSGSPEQLIARHDGCDNLGDVFLALTGKSLRD
jgi:ABC-2 type transport system ATP-binding protein